MIPKTIHYCWFGGNPLPSDVKKYIASWEKHCPDYEICQWDEKNFDVNQNDYCREAYQAKKWAFVADYARAKIIYEHGGVYLDTDVEIVKPLDDLLSYEAFCGFEDESHIMIGTFGAAKGNEWVHMLVENYAGRHFIKPDGSFDLTTNVVMNTDVLVRKYGVKLDNTKQLFGNNMVVLPFDYLIAKDVVTRQIKRTENTYAIHHYAASWVPKEVRYVIDSGNRWVKAAAAIDWPNIEAKYINCLPQQNRDTNMFRLVLGLRIIQDKYGFADQELVDQFIENKYFQYFCGFSQGRSTFPINEGAKAIQLLRRWLPAGKMAEITEDILGKAKENLSADKHSLLDSVLPSTDGSPVESFGPKDAVTVFTPTYNRGYILDKLYGSLRRQTSKCFEWLIVDDGSTDNTEALVSCWLQEEKSFSIRYFKVENGGKHRAINLGVKLASYEAFFIVDSDDYLADDAIEAVRQWFGSVADLPDFAGVSGLRGYALDKPIGGAGNFPEEYADATNLQRGQYNLLGDKSEVYKTSVLAKYPFPEFEEEKFVTEAVVWDAIALGGYKLRWYKKITYLGNYLPDGLTHKGFGLFIESPRGYLAHLDLQEKIYGKGTMEQERYRLYYHLANKAGIAGARQKMRLSARQADGYEQRRKEYLRGMEQQIFFAKENRWQETAKSIDWGKLSEKYSRLWPGIKYNGDPARLIFGVLLLQRQYGFGNGEMIRQLQENKGFRLFLGLGLQSYDVPFTEDTLAYFHQCCPPEILREACGAGLLPEKI